ncbi:MAG TPA: ATP-binding protein [Stenomitos sp.]
MDEGKTRDEVLTELQEARAELRHARALIARGAEVAQAQLNTLIHQLPAFVYTAALDPQGSTQYVSPQIESTYGYTVEEMLRDPGLWARILHPEDHERVLAHYQRSIEEREPFVCDYRVLTKQGRELWVRDTAQLVYGEDGKALFYQGVVFDITDQRQTEAALRRSREDLGRFLRLVPGGMLYLDRNATVRWANADFGHFKSLDPDAIIGHSIYEVLPQIQRPSPRLESVFSTGEPYTAKGLYVPVILEGQAYEHYWDVAYLPVKGDDERVDGIFLFVSDVTAHVVGERQQAERIAQLQELDRLKGDFINTASHELRTPLTSIMGYAEFLEDELGGPLTPEQVAFVHQIQLGVRRLGRIVDDLLDFARMEAGTFTLAMVEADLGQLLCDELESLRPQALIAGVTLECPEPVSLPVAMDPKRIGQVLLNLIGNALKFTPRGGTVRARMRAVDGAVRVEIQDTGIGLLPEHQERIFEKFFQVDPSLTRTHGGAGLGLAIARALIDAHGGTLGVASELGSGSTFWFQLPVKKGLIPGPPGAGTGVQA